ncbi:MAG: MFS transporter [Oligoflexus sp.]
MKNVERMRASDISNLGWQRLKRELKSARGGLLSAGCLILVSVAYFDNVRGPLLPVISTELGIPYSYAGLFLALGNFAAVLSILLLGKILERKNDRIVTVSACLLAMIPGFMAPWIASTFGLLLMGSILGSCVAILGALSNILTIKGAPLHLRGRILSGQQVMYGVGSFLAPFAFTQTMQRQLAWWTVLLIASAIFFSLALVFRRTIPADPPQATPNPTEKAQSKTAPKNYVAILAILAFGFYVGGEVLASMWMTTYMVKQLAMSPEHAASYVGGFFIILAGSRFLSFVLVRPRFETHVIIFCVLSGITALLIAQDGHAWAFALVGLLGPFYPLFMAEISRSFAETWRRLTIWVFVAIQTTLGLIHITVGHITDWIGIRQAFFISPALLLACLCCLLLFLKYRPREEMNLITEEVSL